MWGIAEAFAVEYSKAAWERSARRRAEAAIRAKTARRLRKLHLALAAHGGFTPTRASYRRLKRAIKARVRGELLKPAVERPEAVRM